MHLYLDILLLLKQILPDTLELVQTVRKLTEERNQIGLEPPQT